MAKLCIVLTTVQRNMDHKERNGWPMQLIHLAYVIIFSISKMSQM